MMNIAENQIGSGLVERFEQFLHAYPPIAVSALFKVQAEDFIVDECLPFELSGEGEHCWLHIQKRHSNTDWVAKQLAKTAGVRNRNVGFAGLKDRHGLTSQWFSVHLPGQPDPDWSQIESDEIRVLEVKRHSKKLKRGALKENRFHIVLREFSDTGLADDIAERCRNIAEHGVPNYFGEQRFGHQLGNLASAEEMFSNKTLRLPRNKRSIYLSAARSWLFNQVLSQRVAQANWDKRVAGDVFMLDGKTACFWDDATPELEQRLLQAEIHPTAVLWGEGELETRGQVAEMEQAVAEAFPVFRDGLREFKVKQMRRALRVIPKNLQCQIDNDVLVIDFTLPAGSYATMVLRELVNVVESDRYKSD